MTRAGSQRNNRGSLDGRAAATQAVGDVLAGRRFASESLAALREHAGLGGREAALAMEIAQGAVRHALGIDHLLSALARYDRWRVAPALRAILLTSVYQIVWMDRIPVFAAVDEAVKQARRQVGGRAPGMINALLRKLAAAIENRRTAWTPRDRRLIRTGWDAACRFGEAVLPSGDTDIAAHLAAATGEHSDRVADLVSRHGVESAEEVLWASQAVPVTVLHRQRLRINPGVFQSRVREAFGDAADWTPDAAFLPASVNVVDADLFREGRAYVQDTTAHAAAALMGARPGETLLDFCAAPGGKSVVLAQQMDDRGEVVACDASPDRILRVRDNARRLRLTSIRTHLIKTSNASEPDLTRLFDGALVDVPCSNTGVIARRPEARLGLSREKLNSLTSLQTALLSRAAASVRPGGRLVYSTCSIEPRENEGIVKTFLDQHAEWRLDSAGTTLPAWGRRLRDWRDGGFAALLLRSQ